MRVKSHANLRKKLRLTQIAPLRPLRGAAKEDGQLASQRQGKVFTARFEGFNRPWRRASHESDP
jgi:hypothetical protein